MKILFPWIPDWVDWNIAVPVAATVVVVVVGIVVICVALSRKAHGPLQTRLRSDCMCTGVVQFINIVTIFISFWLLSYFYVSFTGHSRI